MDETRADRVDTSASVPSGDDYSDCGRRAARPMAVAFIIYGLIGTALLGLNTPPFQVADETNHFKRAEQIADGGFTGTRFAQTLPDGRTETEGGGTIDPALGAAAAPFELLQFHPELRVKQADWAPDVHWSGKRELAGFPMANYPPFFYLPSAAGILAGQELGLSVVRTLYLSRLMTGLIAVALGALAIAIADRAAPWIFAILTLPMSLSLMASASQDALLIACAALAGALLTRAIYRTDPDNGKLLTGLAILLALVAMARPPFGALAILPLGVPRVQLWRRLLASLAVAACTLAWARIAAVTSLGNFGAYVGADPARQIQLMLHHPLLGIEAIAAALTMWKRYLIEFIGVLGWLDTSLPPNYYRAAKVMLVIAAVASMLGTRRKPMTFGSFFALASGIALAVLGVFLVQYVAWTPPGSLTVDGIEGRYFLAPALVGAALLPRFGRVPTPRLHKALVALLCLFPIVSLAVAIRALVLRYYLG